MALDDLVTGVATALIPPDNGGKSAAWRRYNLTVSGTLLGLGVIMGLHIAWACGFLATIGLSGFASAADVNAQQQTLNSIQQRQIERDIRDDKRQVCLAQQGRNYAALDSWSRTLEQAKGQYYSVSKMWPHEQSCDELVIAGQQAP